MMTEEEVKRFQQEEAERRKQRALKEVEALRKAAGVIPEVNKVIKSFDGKVYNKKFDEALRPLRVYVDKSYDGKTLFVRYSDYRRTIAKVELKLEEGKRPRIIYNQHSSIPYREEYLKKAYEIESNIDMMEYNKQYIEEAIEKMNSFLDNIPEELKKAYDIPYYLRSMMYH